MAFRLLLLAGFLLFHLRPAAQILPPVVNHAPERYRAGRQNWGLSQDEHRFVYVANNDGLLEYDGARWRFYPSPNASILRGVAAIDGRVYTGGYRDFGYWERTPNGGLRYHRLSTKVADRLLPDEHIWRIDGYGPAVVFQSLQQLFFYRPDRAELTVVQPPAGITKSFRLGERLLFTDRRRGLYRVDGGEVAEVLPPGAAPAPIVHVWSAAGRTWVQTETAGTFVLDGNALRAEPRRFDFLRGSRLYAVTDLAGGGLAFGTISNGLYLTDADGRLTYHLTQANGLTNNTILSLFEDAAGNVWAGADNGINCINLPAPVRKYTDRTGRLGTVYDAARYGGRLYLATNQGLFVDDGVGGFTLVDGTRGQVWSLTEHDGSLFCGRDLGGYVVTAAGLQPLFTDAGAWTFVPIPGRPDLLLVGTYTGLRVLERSGDRWRLRNAVDDFDLSSRYLALRPDGKAYVSHEYRGVYGLQFDADYRRVERQSRYEVPAEEGRNAGLMRYGDSIYYHSRAGLYVLRGLSEGFTPSTLNVALDTNQYVSGRMTVVDDQLWFTTAAGPGYFRPALTGSTYERTDVPLEPDLLQAPTDYENVTLIGTDSLLLGTADGFLLLARAAVAPRPHRVHLTAWSSATAAGERQPLALGADAGGKGVGGKEVDYRAHNLRFKLAVPNYERFLHPRYRYRLLGAADAENWSAWQTESTIELSELPYGDYVFEAQSRLGPTVSDNTVRRPFTVLRPWYLTYPALVGYLLLLAGLGFTLHRSYRTYYRNQQRRWQQERERQIRIREREAELEVARLRNQALQEAVEGKSREAARSTMDLVRKNELLQQIRGELLAKQSPEQNIRRVVRTIDANLEEAGTWATFRQAFESADPEFFKRLQARHPELTASDLKLCAYLRLNLSTKEVAPLLNISPRSVEVKRYRLRKKIGLNREAGLTEYVLSI